MPKKVIVNDKWCTECQAPKKELKCSRCGHPTTVYCLDTNHIKLKVYQPAKFA